MIRYTRPSGHLYVEDNWADHEDPLCPDIHVPVHLAVDTGLLWPDGSRVIRAPNPIGFGGSFDE